MAFSENEELPILNTADMDFMVGQVIHVQASDDRGVSRNLIVRILNPQLSKVGFQNEIPLKKMEAQGWITIADKPEVAEPPGIEWMGGYRKDNMPIMTPDPQEAEKRAAVDDTGQERRVIAAQIKAEAGNSPFISVKKVLDIIGV